MFRRKGNAFLEFPKEGNYKIWMLFVFYPLDLIFINKNKTVVNIIKNTRPITLNPKTWKLYNSRNKFKYLLELDCRNHSSIFNIGDVLEWHILN